jgi:hypothetical protein
LASGIAESATAHAANLQIAAIALRAPVANGVDAKVMWFSGWFSDLG